MTDATVEQTTCQRRCTQHAAADSTGTLTKDGYLIRIATKLGNVTLYPLQGINLIQQSVVTRVSVFAFLSQFGMGHKA